MKKALSILLVSMLAMSMTACGSKDESSSKTEETTTQAVTEADNADDTAEVTDASEDNGSETETPAESDNNGSGAETADGTVGEVLFADFSDIVKSGSCSNSTEIAEQLITNNIIADYSMITMDVEEGLLNGFDNNEISGFSQGCTFAPMIGSIPFVGYIFQLEEGSDAAAFMDTLKSSANLRWNVCVEADEMTCESVDNYVFFLMSPKTLEE